MAENIPNKLEPKDGFIAIFMSALFIFVFSYFNDLEDSSPIVFEIFCVFLPSLIILLLRGGFKTLFTPIFAEKKEAQFGFLLFIFAFLFGFSTANLINLLFDINEVIEELYRNILQYNFFSQVILFALIPAIFEEILFRGVILKSLAKMGKTISFLLTSTLFAFYHGSFELFLPIFILSAFLTTVGFFRGGLTLAILFHFIFNLLNLLSLNYLKWEIGLLTSIVIAAFSFPFYLYFLLKGLKNV